MPDKTPQPFPADSIKWPPLVSGVLLKRYKRFLADVRLADGTRITAHCPNSGSMQACKTPGRPVYLSRHDNPKRKLKYTWELIEMPESLVGVNTLVPNRLVAKAIEGGKIDALAGYSRIKPEVKVTDRSRLDLMLTHDDRRPCYVEIKNCTLVRDGIAAFPDAVTSRGLKHLAELQTLVEAGNRCAMFFLIQRMDARHFRPADDIDPAYGHKLRQVKVKGVEILAYDVHIDLEHIRINRPVPLEL